MIKTKFKIGDRVAYTQRFLQSIGAYTGELPQMRGTVLEIMEMKGGDNKYILNVKMDGCGKIMPILATNLCRVTKEGGILDPTI